MFIAAGTQPNTVLAREDAPHFLLDGKYFRACDENGETVQPAKALAKPERAEVLLTRLPDGRFVSYFGDLHPSFFGNVVKALGSTKQGYPVVSRVLAQRPPASGESDGAFIARLDRELRATVHEVKRLTPTIVELIVKAPAAARRFRPGQFYRLQNFATRSTVADGTLLQMEGLALTGAWVDPARGLVSTIVLEMGGSSNLCARLAPGEPVVLMGPTGSPTHIPANETAILVGGGLGNAVLFSIGQALRAANSRVLYFAGYKKEIDRYKVADIEAAADVIVWCCDEEPGFQPDRPQDFAFVGNIVQAMEAYASGRLGAPPIPLSEGDHIIAIGSDRMMAAVARARHGVLAPYLNPHHFAIGSINSPMQCMMKEICAQCLQPQRDPRTGEVTYVFSCFNQDQPLDCVDFHALSDRLRQNSLQEKLTAQWIAHCLPQPTTTGERDGVAPGRGGQHECGGMSALGGCRRRGRAGVRRPARHLRRAARRCSASRRRMARARAGARCARRHLRARQRRLGHRLPRRDLGRRRGHRRQPAPRAARSRPDPERQRSALRVVRARDRGAGGCTGRVIARWAGGRGAAAAAGARDWTVAMQRATQIEPAESDDEAPALWIGTSGTTGIPKGVIHPQRVVVHAHAFAGQVLGATAADRFYSTSKLFFAYALGNSLFAGLRVGATVILDRERATPERTREMVARHRPTLVFTVPTLYSKMLQENVAPSLADAGIRHFVSAGEALPATVRSGWRRATGNAPISGYGTSETLCLALYGDDDSGLLRPTPLTLVRYADDIDPDIPQRISVRLPTLALGYWRRPEAQADGFRDGWYSPGDMFIRREGRLEFAGRTDDLLKVSGQWVSTLWIEHALTEAGGDAIDQVAAVGVETPEGLTTIAALAVAVRGREDQARDRIGAGIEKLPKYRRPRWVHWVTELPLTATGKLQRSRLRAAHESALSAGR